MLLHNPNRFIESNGIAAAYNGAHFQGPYLGLAGLSLMETWGRQDRAQWSFSLTWLALKPSYEAMGFGPTNTALLFLQPPIIFSSPPSSVNLFSFFFSSFFFTSFGVNTESFPTSSIQITSLDCGLILDALNRLLPAIASILCRRLTLLRSSFDSQRYSCWDY